jgi:hypothetical protein
VPILDRAVRATRRVTHRLRARGAWFAYVAVALACTWYLNARAALVPKWGRWYAADGHPYITLQVRAFLSGRLALVAHPSGAGHDYDWGRGGMHQAWGLGVSMLAVPFHLLGRLFGAPGFPDSVRFLICYALVAVVLARVLHKAGRGAPNALAAGCAAAGFMMVFPTFVGMVSSRFQIYEQTIAFGCLWNILLLAGVVALSYRCTPWRLAAVCAAAGFSVMVRPPIAVYGVSTTAIALFIAYRKGLGPAKLLGGIASYAGATGLYLLGNDLRFGSPFQPGYGNCLAGTIVNRLLRWGLPFEKEPFLVQFKEMFAELFLLAPVPNQVMMGAPPASIQPYVMGAERWREYYAPTFDLLILVLWLVAALIVGVRFFRRRLWRREGEIGHEVTAIVGAWAIPPALVLFVFYTRLGNTVTRYASDMFPALAAGAMCVGMAVVEAARKRAPALASSFQLAIAAMVALYLGGWHGWAEHLSEPVDVKTVTARIADIDAHSSSMPMNLPHHFKCGGPNGPSPVHTHLEDWSPDCTFRSGMVFAMPHDRCVSFTFKTAGGPTASWGAREDESLAGFRVKADFDSLERCAGPPVVSGDTRQITMCDPRAPRFLLDGMRLYSIASLDDKFTPIDRLKLMRIDGAEACH